MRAVLASSLSAWIDHRAGSKGAALAFYTLFSMMPILVLAIAGAGFTAVLFSLGKYAIGLYLRTSSLASSFGAAGSLIALLLWGCYSAQVFFLGAEFTRQFALRYGSLRRPDPLSGTGPKPRRQSGILRTAQSVRGAMSLTAKAPEATDARQPAHRISVELGSVVLDTLGLVEAVEWHLQRFQKRTGILCDLTVRDAAGLRLPEESAETIFDIYTEALRNIASRALATRAAVVLTITELDVALVVRDDRVGTTVRTSVPVVS